MLRRYIPHAEGSVLSSGFPRKDQKATTDIVSFCNGRVSRRDVAFGEKQVKKLFTSNATGEIAD